MQQSVKFTKNSTERNHPTCRHSCRQLMRKVMKKGQASSAWQNGYNNSDNHSVQASQNVNTNTTLRWMGYNIRRSHQVLLPSALKAWELKTWGGKNNCLLKWVSAETPRWWGQNLAPTACRVSTAQAGGGGIMMWGMYFYLLIYFAHF